MPVAQETQTFSSKKTFNRRSVLFLRRDTEFEVRQEQRNNEVKEVDKECLCFFVVKVEVTSPALEQQPSSQLARYRT